MIVGLFIWTGRSAGRQLAGPGGIGRSRAKVFVEMFVGVGASRVRDLFADARRRAPSIIRMVPEYGMSPALGLDATAGWTAAGS